MQEQGPRRVYIDKASPASYQAFRRAAKAVHTETVAAGLKPALLELVNVRVSQLKGCAFCLNVHIRAALRAGESSTHLVSCRAGGARRCSPYGSGRRSAWPRRSHTRRTPPSAGPSPAEGRGMVP
ncbi:carboxymuconolactone decarboxylase family protein [Streptomyces sp. NPDC056309]|uniref:carboxymuconolactone decarboxylase family protein n=1 Tax=Streptomyces sp. NPDC056309 TaxID=3345781 RepID=UPI0035E39154